MRGVTPLKLLLVAVVFICSCARGGNSPIGLWSNVQTPETVAFRADRSGVFEVKDRPSLAFTWTSMDDARVKIDIRFQGGVRTLLGRVEGENFILEGTGQQATYHKVRQ